MNRTETIYYLGIPLLRLPEFRNMLYVHIATILQNAEVSEAALDIFLIHTEYSLEFSTDGFEIPKTIHLLVEYDSAEIP